MDFRGVFGLGPTFWSSLDTMVNEKNVNRRYPVDKSPQLHLHLGACDVWKIHPTNVGYPRFGGPPGELINLQEINISHLGKLGTSSSNMPFLGGYVSSLEGIC